MDLQIALIRALAAWKSVTYVSASRQYFLACWGGGGRHGIMVRRMYIIINPYEQEV